MHHDGRGAWCDQPLRRGAAGASGRTSCTRLAAELAQLAVGRERLRISRDLHDLLGQSLSAVSLKGDLALRLLPSDPTGGAGGDRGLTAIARAALRDVRSGRPATHMRVAARPRPTGAAAPAAAAGIDARFDVDLGGLPPRVENVLGLGGAGGCHQRAAPQRCQHLHDHRRPGGRGLPAGDRQRRRAATPSGDGTGLAGLIGAGDERSSGSVSAGTPSVTAGSGCGSRSPRRSA